MSASPPPVIRMPGSAGEPPHPYRPDVPNLFDWDQPEEESMLNNATLCGHLAVAALLMMNLGALASQAARRFADEVAHRKFPGDEHSFE